MAKTSVTTQHRKNQQREDVLPSDAEILTALQHDIPSAFVLLDCAYRPLLYSLAMREMKDPDDAEECIQDTFLRAFRSLTKSNQQHPSRTPILSPKAWLCKILNNVMKDAKFVKSRHKAVSLSPYNFDDIMEKANSYMYSEDAEQAMLRQETIHQLQTLLQQLSPIKQQVILLRFVYAMNFAEIGARLHIPIGTARSYASRAISCLQHYIDQQPLADGSFLAPSDSNYWEKVHMRPFRAASHWLFDEEMQMEFGSHD